MQSRTFYLCVNENIADKDNSNTAQRVSGENRKTIERFDIVLFPVEGNRAWLCICYTGPIIGSGKTKLDRWRFEVVSARFPSLGI